MRLLQLPSHHLAHNLDLRPLAQLAPAVLAHDPWGSAAADLGLERRAGVKEWCGRGGHTEEVVTLVVVFRWWTLVGTPPSSVLLTPWQTLPSSHILSVYCAASLGSVRSVGAPAVHGGRYDLVK